MTNKAKHVAWGFVAAAVNEVGQKSAADIKKESLRIQNGVSKNNKCGSVNSSYI